MVAELSATVSNAGTFALDVGEPSNPQRYRLQASGSTGIAVIMSSDKPAPNTAVLAGSADFSLATTEAALRVDGVSQNIVSGTAGDGSFGNYPLYIGRRGGSSLPFNGRLYGLIVRGAQSSAAQITSAERWVAQRTGVTL